MQALLAAGDRDAAVALFLRAVASVSQREVDALRAAPSWAGRLAAAHTILREMQNSNSYAFEPRRFTDFKTPTLLLLGGQSRPMFRDAIRLLSDTLPNCRVVEMPGQEHAAMNTAPMLFLREVNNFLLAPA
jgi:pimeloyl-ACP methyl ester carboxylesterase